MAVIPPGESSQRSTRSWRSSTLDCQKLRKSEVAAAAPLWVWKNSRQFVWQFRKCDDFASSALYSSAQLFTAHGTHGRSGPYKSFYNLGKLSEVARYAFAKKLQNGRDQYWLNH